MRIVPVTGGMSVLLVGGGKNDFQATLGTLSPDGSTLATFVLGPGVETGICIAHADGTNLRALVSGPGVLGPRWAPDGTRIAYINTKQPIGRIQDLRGRHRHRRRPPSWPRGIRTEWLDNHTLIIEHVSPG